MSGAPIAVLDSCAFRGFATPCLRSMRPSSARSRSGHALARGTLTEEERYKINEHMVQTIMMLSQLPFPKHLRQVPEIAGGHHEKMDGNGYPKMPKATRTPFFS